MLLSAGDMPRRRHLIDNDAPGAGPDSEVARHKWNLFLELMRFAEGGSCRHDAVLRYFGDEEETLSGCGRCDVCVRLASGGGAADGGADDPDAESVELLVRKALSGVARIHGRYGLGAATALLRGSKDERLERGGLHRTPTFGALAEYSEEWLTRLLRRCVTAGWVDFFGGDRPVVALTEEGIRVMRGEHPARLLLPPLRRGKRAAGKSARTSGGARKASSASEPESLSASDVLLFEALRSHRLEVARELNVPPYVVASDRTLREIARFRPHDLDELQLANGIGPTKAERYGAGLLEVVQRHAE